MTIVEHNIGNLKGYILIPDKGKLLKNIYEEKIYEGKIFIKEKELSKDYEEIDEEVR